MSHAARRGPTPRFSRDELAARALSIMDERGPDGLTMRALAAELGMGTMALYRYFPSKETLIDAAIDVATPEIALTESGARPWREQLEALARQLFAAGIRHPSLARERFNRPLQSAGALKITDRAVALLLEAGLSRADAVAAFKALLLHTLGAAWFASSESEPAVRRRAADRHAALDRRELPAMTAVADELTAALGGEEAFEFGLRALLDYAAAASSTSSSSK
jgi:AcrR family transcriptional regulator